MVQIAGYLMISLTKGLKTHYVELILNRFLVLHVTSMNLKPWKCRDKIPETHMKVLVTIMWRKKEESEQFFCLLCTNWYGEYHIEPTFGNLILSPHIFMLIYPKPTTATYRVHTTPHSLFCFHASPPTTKISSQRLHGFALLCLGAIFCKVISALSGYVGNLVIILQPLFRVIYITSFLNTFIKIISFSQ